MPPNISKNRRKKNDRPSNGFFKSSKNPLLRNIMAGCTLNNTTIISPTNPNIFNLSIISIKYSTNIRNIPEKTKEISNYFQFIFA